MSYLQQVENYMKDVEIDKVIDFEGFPCLPILTLRRAGAGKTN